MPSQEHLMTTSVPFRHPCVVLGSAPDPSVPPGPYHLICVNSSGYAARALGLPEPDVTVLAGFKLIHPNREEDRQALRGLRTRTLLLVTYLLPVPLAEAERMLAELDFRYERLETVDFDGRARVIEGVTGSPLGSEAAPESRVSNGIFAACYALQAGAPCVVLCGISLTSGGHFYSDRGRPRRHIASDTAALVALQARGWPVQTTDAGMARATGMPLFPATTPA
jgi:hypothetical protein